MPELSHQQAQRRVDDILAFERELGRLQDEGALRLDNAQREGLHQHQQRLLADYRARFDIDRDSQDHRLSLGMRIASFLGALALAASLFFLFYQFWGLFAETAQVVILIAAALGSLLLTLALQQRDASGYFAKLAAMLAFACLVLNVLMIGQIFNITPSDKALLPWAAYALLLAYTCDARLLLATALICLMGYVAARVGTWSGAYWLDVGERPENFFPAALLIFLVPSFIAQGRFDGFAAIYRVFGLLGLFLPMLVLANWGGGSYLPLGFGAVEHLYQLLGFVASALVIWLGARREWPEVVNTGLTFFVIFLYTKFFDWWWEVMPKYLFFLVLGLCAVLILLILRRLRSAHGLLGGASA
ncbi:DUF2157 domain-containing protein [Pseudomonas sp. CAN2814]|uniref:DUF2157 domain-containing protein n=1 Tax=Pseudomonas sp. CAN1 TaxID=3046726 RepID=UPI0026497438|nr:DUF2157 domain-containing protein [Pseudomonas sp. CAN1]MDN6859285.1 DUF2157 domain-containing protein [Pseudomonas sp. CAN1]